MRGKFFGVLVMAVALGAGGVWATPPAVSLSSVAGYAIDNGDINGDWQIDIADPISLLVHLFANGASPVELAYCGAEPAAVANGDANGDGYMDIGDAVRLLDYLWGSGPAPAQACPAARRGGGTPRVAPPHSRAFGLSLAEWSEVYWRWFLTGADPEEAVLGRTMLLPMPAGEYVSGSWTPDDPALLVGSVDVVLGLGTSFTIPQFAWISETYDPALGYPDDTPIPDDMMLACVSPRLTLDGALIMSDGNKDEFYVGATYFDPIIMYSEPTEYGSIGAIAFQGCSAVFPPLPPGEHVLHLYEPYVVDDVMGFTFGVIYNNTWNITVAP